MINMVEENFSKNKGEIEGYIRESHSRELIFAYYMLFNFMLLGLFNRELDFLINFSDFSSIYFVIFLLASNLGLYLYHKYIGRKKIIEMSEKVKCIEKTSKGLIRRIKDDVSVFVELNSSLTKSEFEVFKENYERLELLLLDKVRKFALKDLVNYLHFLEIVDKAELLVVKNREIKNERDASIKNKEIGVIDSVENIILDLKEVKNNIKNWFNKILVINKNSSTTKNVSEVTLKSKKKGFFKIKSI